jgi:hypothetical protein
MGGGSWDTGVYDAAAKYRASTGASAFGYSDTLRTSARPSTWKAHPSLDPHGVHLRESRDGDEHPHSQAIAVLFDVTGSMGQVPRVLQTKLPELLGLLIRKGYVAHPQLMFGAIGDATCDRVPLQIGQFESDNRLDENLGRILLEGGGGGQKTESYELAMYFLARHTSIDCYEKRGKRGYLFIIGDELPYPRVKRQEVERVIGDKSLAQDIPTAEIVTELKRRYEVYYILPEGAAYAGDSEILGAWRALLGQNVIQLDDLDAVSETIALTIGLAEDAIDLDEGLADLSDVGSTAGASVSKALAALGANRAAPGAAAALPGLAESSATDCGRAITRL